MRGKRPALSLDLDCFFDVNSHVYLILFYFSYKRGQYESNTMADDKSSQNVPFIHNHFSGHHEVLISNQSCVFWSWLPLPIATLFLLHRNTLCCKLPLNLPTQKPCPFSLDIWQEWYWQPEAWGPMPVSAQAATTTNPFSPISSSLFSSDAAGHPKNPSWSWQ